MDKQQTDIQRRGNDRAFKSPAQDYIEELIDLGRILDLRKPGIYPVRVKGQAMLERGIRDGDILIANTALRPAHGKVAVAILQGSFRLATLEHRARRMVPASPSDAKEALPVSDDAEVWAIVAGLVRETV